MNSTMSYSALAHITLAMVNRVGVSRRPYIVSRGRGLARLWTVLVDDTPVRDQDAARWTLTALERAGLITWERPLIGPAAAGLTTEGARLLRRWDAAVYAPAAEETAVQA